MPHSDYSIDATLCRRPTQEFGGNDLDVQSAPDPPRMAVKGESALLQSALASTGRRAGGRACGRARRMRARARTHICTHTGATHTSKHACTHTGASLRAHAEALVLTCTLVCG